MPFAFVEDGSVTEYPVGSGEIRRRFPNTLFTLPLEGQDLADFGAYEVQPTDQPSINALTQRLQEGTPALVDGAWQQTWQVVDLPADEQQAINDVAAHGVRQDRNKKLADSDWTVLADSPLTTAKKTEWKTYRAALRDITAAEGFPHTMEWPTEPS